MKNSRILLLGLLFLACVASLVFWSPFRSYQAQAELERAAQAYSAAEHAKTIGERKDRFNQALDLYAALEKEYQPIMGTGKLYFNIGNCYFQLGEYPMASWYYHRAAKLTPRSARVKSHMDLVNQKLAIEEAHAESLLSLPEKFQLFALLCFCSWSLASLFLWLGGKLFKYAAIAGTALCLCLILSLGYNFYFGPVEAILVRSTGLYRDAGFQYTHVVQEPILSGSKVEVLEAKEGGRWLKVLTPNGTLGYVPSETVKTI